MLWFLTPWENHRPTTTNMRTGYNSIMSQDITWPKKKKDLDYKNINYDGWMDERFFLIFGYLFFWKTDNWTGLKNIENLNNYLPTMIVKNNKNKLIDYLPILQFPKKK